MKNEEILTKTKEQMTKSLEFCQSQITKVRTGKASASLVENVRIDYYGNLSPLSQIASINVPDAKTIIIQPWDRTTLAAIEKAIQQADLGFNPQNDGNIIRIPVPPLTEERRKEFVKLSKKYAEEGKIAIRNIRRDQMEALKKAEKNKEISEDERKRTEEEIQKITDKFIKDIDAIFTKKENELLEV